MQLAGECFIKAEREMSGVLLDWSDSAMAPRWAGVTWRIN